MIWLNAAEYGRLHGVSRQRVMDWVKEKRLDCWTPKKGVFLIDMKTPRPEIKKGGRPTNFARNNLLSL